MDLTLGIAIPYLRVASGVARVRALAAAAGVFALNAGGRADDEEEAHHDLNVRRT